MNWLDLAAESSIRTLALAIVAALLLLRVRSSHTRLTAWTAVLYAGLVMPMLPVALRYLTPMEPLQFTMPVGLGPLPTVVATAPPFNWFAFLEWAYLGIAAILLLRTLVGLLLTARLVQSAQVVPQLGRDVRECTGIDVPVTFGGTVLLPPAWRTWDRATLESVLVHEASHIERGDTITLLLARIHRAVFWFSPLSWWLAAHIVELAEQTSDDAALIATTDRPRYAEVLVGFASRATGREPTAGLGMARPSTIGRRVERILDAAFEPAKALSWKGRTVVLAAAVPLVLIIAGVTAVRAQQQPNPPAKPQSATPPSAPGKSDSFLWHWVIVDGDKLHMSGMGEDAVAARAARGKYREPYLWIRNSDVVYVTDDRALIAEAEAFWRPMEELGKQQADLGREQAALGMQQAELGRQQASASGRAPDLEAKILGFQAKLRALRGRDATQEEVAGLQAELGAMQAELGRSQAVIGGVQGALGEKQGELGRQQAVLGGKQAILGGQQAKLAEEANRKMEDLVNRAIRDGRASRQ